jgi:hypothetical protein
MSFSDPSESPSSAAPASPGGERSSLTTLAVVKAILCAGAAQAHAQAQTAPANGGRGEPSTTTKLPEVVVQEAQEDSYKPESLCRRR